MQCNEWDVSYIYEFFLFSGRASNEHNREIGIAKMTIVITASFVLLNIPYVISNSSTVDSSNQFFNSFGYFVMITTDKLCVGLNMLVDLITYSVLSTNFKNTVKQLFSRKRTKGKSQSMTGISHITRSTEITDSETTG